MTSKQFIENLLGEAGVKIGGTNDWDIQVSDDSFYDRVFREGSLALGETYMDGLWDCKALDQFFYKILSAHLDQKVKFSWAGLSLFLRTFLFNLQTKTSSFKVGEQHYNIGNDLYKAMLDKRLVYTCGYWKDANNLDEAQEAKLDLSCRKIGLKEGDTVLDIGCGWGSFLKFAAEKYGIKGTGVTVSSEQVDLARKLCEGLPIEIRLEDYRNTDGQFDHIVSLGMFEHVGVKNYRTYMKTAHKLLKDDGLFLLHTIGLNFSSMTTDPWIEKYIFPNSNLPSIAQIGKAVEGLFVIEDLHNFGTDYDKTLMAWFNNFEKSWSELKGKYSERFYRMWKYYLLACAGSFRARNIQLWQFILSKNGVKGGYMSIR